LSSPPLSSAGGDKNKGLSQEEVDKIIAYRLTRQEEKFKENLAEERKKWEADAQLSEKERKEKEAKEREQAQLEKENNIALRENRLTLVEKMAEAKVPTIFADFLVTSNTDKTIENFNTFKTAWEKSMEDYLKDKISTNSIKTENQTKTETVGKNGAVIRENGQAIL
jgi:hypothetical protein